MAHDHTVTCPHCLNNVPWGARVCRGCHAEISYGTPFSAVVVFTVLSVGAAWFSAKFAHDHLSTNPTFLWWVFGGVLAVSSVLSWKACKRLYNGSTSFSRRYRK